MIDETIFSLGRLRALAFCVEIKRENRERLVDVERERERGFDWGGIGEILEGLNGLCRGGAGAGGEMGAFVLPEEALKAICFHLWSPLGR